MHFHPHTAMCSTVTPTSNSAAQVPIPVPSCFEDVSATPVLTLRFFNVELLAPRHLPKLCLPLMRHPLASGRCDRRVRVAGARAARGGTSLRDSLRRGWKEE